MVLKSSAADAARARAISSGIVHTKCSSITLVEDSSIRWFSKVATPKAASYLAA